MILHDVCLTYHLDNSEVDKFKEILMDEGCSATDWESESNCIDYDIDRRAIYYTLYDVYFESIEEAQGFNSDVKKVLNEK